MKSSLLFLISNPRFFRVCMFWRRRKGLLKGIHAFSVRLKSIVLGYQNEELTVATCAVNLALAAAS